MHHRQAASKWAFRRGGGGWNKLEIPKKQEPEKAKTGSFTFLVLECLPSTRHCVKCLNATCFKCSHPVISSSELRDRRGFLQYLFSLHQWNILQSLRDCLEWNSVSYSRSGTLKLQPVIHILMKISLSCGHVAAEDLRSRKLSLQAPRRREQESKNTLWWESAAGDNEEITEWNPLFKQPPLVQPYGISRRWDATTNSSKQKQWNKR